MAEAVGEVGEEGEDEEAGEAEEEEVVAGGTRDKSGISSLVVTTNKCLIYSPFGIRSSSPCFSSPYRKHLHSLQYSGVKGSMRAVFPPSREKGG